MRGGGSMHRRIWLPLPNIPSQKSPTTLVRIHGRARPCMVKVRPLFFVDIFAKLHAGRWAVTGAGAALLPRWVPITSYLPDGNKT